MPMLTNSKPISWLAETAINPLSCVLQSQLWSVSSCLVSSVTLYCISRKRALASPLNIPKPRRIHPSASKPRSLPPLTGGQNSQQPAADEPSSASQTQTAELISKGQKAIDKMWKESGIDTIRSVEKKSEAFYRFIDKSNDFITTTYPQTFSKDIAGSKKTDIIYELSSYTTERYVKPTLSRFQSSK